MKRVAIYFKGRDGEMDQYWKELENLEKSVRETNDFLRAKETQLKEHARKSSQAIWDKIKKRAEAGGMLPESIKRDDLGLEWDSDSGVIWGFSETEARGNPLAALTKILGGR